MMAFLPSGYTANDQGGNNELYGVENVLYGYSLSAPVQMWA